MARESNSDVLLHWRSVAARRESELIFAENRSPSFQRNMGAGYINQAYFFACLFKTQADFFETQAKFSKNSSKISLNSRNFP